MIHFVYLVAFALFISVAFGAFAEGSSRERIIYGAKSFAQFLVISLLLAWVLYFLPWS
jgi:hypothetical protein